MAQRRGNAAASRGLAEGDAGGGSTPMDGEASADTGSTAGPGVSGVGSKAGGSGASRQSRAVAGGDRAPAGAVPPRSPARASGRSARDGIVDHASGGGGLRSPAAGPGAGSEAGFSADAREGDAAARGTSHGRSVSSSAALRDRKVTDLAAQLDSEAGGGAGGSWGYGSGPEDAIMWSRRGGKVGDRVSSATAPGSPPRTARARGPSGPSTDAPEAGPPSEGGADAASPRRGGPGARRRLRNARSNAAPGAGAPPGGLGSPGPGSGGGGGGSKFVPTALRGRAPVGGGFAARPAVLLGSPGAPGATPAARPGPGTSAAGAAAGAGAGAGAGTGAGGGTPAGAPAGGAAASPSPTGAAAGARPGGWAGGSEWRPPPFEVPRVDSGGGGRDVPGSGGRARARGADDIEDAGFRVRSFSDSDALHRMGRLLDFTRPMGKPTLVQARTDVEIRRALLQRLNVGKREAVSAAKAHKSTATSSMARAHNRAAQRERGRAAEAEDALGGSKAGAGGAGGAGDGSGSAGDADAASASGGAGAASEKDRLQRAQEMAAAARARQRASYDSSAQMQSRLAKDPAAMRRNLIMRLQHGGPPPRSVPPKPGDMRREASAPVQMRGHSRRQAELEAAAAGGRDGDGDGDGSGSGGEAARSASAGPGAGGTSTSGAGGGGGEDEGDAGVEAASDDMLGSSVGSSDSGLVGPGGGAASASATSLAAARARRIEREARRAARGTAAGASARQRQGQVQGQGQGQGPGGASASPKAASTASDDVLAAVVAAGGIDGMDGMFGPRLGLRDGTTVDAESQQQRLRTLSELRQARDLAGIDSDDERWVDSGKVSACQQCGTAFTVLNRKHHCRACGLVVCGSCSPYRVHLSALDAVVRVCRECNALRLGSVWDHRPDTELFFDAVLRGDTLEVEARLEEGQDVAATDWLTGGTALHVAAGAGQAETAKLLLKGGAFVNATNYLGRTPLHMAAFSGAHEAVGPLLRAGALLDITDLNGDTPRELAVRGGHKKVVSRFKSADAGGTNGAAANQPLVFIQSPGRDSRKVAMPSWRVHEKVADLSVLEPAGKALQLNLIAVRDEELRYMHERSWMMQTVGGRSVLDRYEAMGLLSPQDRNFEVEGADFIIGAAWNVGHLYGAEVDIADAVYAVSQGVRLEDWLAAGLEDEEAGEAAHDAGADADVGEQEEEEEEEESDSDDERHGGDRRRITRGVPAATAAASAAAAAAAAGASPAASTPTGSGAGASAAAAGGDGGRAPPASPGSSSGGGGAPPASPGARRRA